MKTKTKLFSNLAALFSLVILVALDQCTKHLAVKNLSDGKVVVLLKDVFQLTYVENNGAAFGMFQGHQEVFLAVSILSLCFFAYIYEKIPFEKRYRMLRIALCVLSAGAIGNMIDRFFNGYVVDFFYFVLIDFPVFNVADCFVCVSIAFFIVLILFYYKEDELNKIRLLPGKGRSKAEE